MYCVLLLELDDLADHFISETLAAIAVCYGQSIYRTVEYKLRADTTLSFKQTYNEMGQYVKSQGPQPPCLQGLFVFCGENLTLTLGRAICYIDISALQSQLDETRCLDPSGHRVDEYLYSVTALLWGNILAGRLLYNWTRYRANNRDYRIIGEFFRLDRHPAKVLTYLWEK